MARNAEKNLCGLNRYVLAKREEGKSAEKTARPSVKSLTSAEEAKKWIPNIKKEIDYCLRQIECATRRNYSDQMVKEFEERVERLEKEHWLFVHKVQELDPATVGVPWQGRGYTTKRLQPQTGRVRHLCAVESSGALTSALLGELKQREECSRVVGADDSKVDVRDISYALNSGMVYHTPAGIGVTNSNQGHASDVINSSSRVVSSATMASSKQKAQRNETAGSRQPEQGLRCASPKTSNPLGLEYRSSSDEEEEEAAEDR